MPLFNDIREITNEEEEKSFVSRLKEEVVKCLVTNHSLSETPLGEIKDVTWEYLNSIKEQAFNKEAFISESVKTVITKNVLTDWFVEQCSTEWYKTGKRNSH